jgi:hypothetical protein
LLILKFSGEANGRNGLQIKEVFLEALWLPVIVNLRAVVCYLRNKRFQISLNGIDRRSEYGKTVHKILSLLEFWRINQILKEDLRT